MSRNTMFILAGGFLFAIIAALLVQTMLGNKGKDQNTPAQTVQILVANKDIGMGEDFTGSNMQWKNWPVETLPTNAIKREEKELPAVALSGKARRSVLTGEALSSDLTVKDDGKSFISSALGAGMRAISIRVTAQSSVSGFVGPGDKVDVVVTYDVRLPADDRIQAAATNVVTRSAAETLVENVRVLGVDQTSTRSPDAKVAKTITLEVTPQQAEELNLAEKMGELSLSLRGASDDKVIGEDKSTTDVRISKVMRELNGGSTGASQTATIRLYQGTNIQNVDVNRVAE